MRGKENLVLIREMNGGLLLHTMYFADEVRDFSEIDKGQDAKIKSGEVDLAHRLIDELASDKFEPEKYHDDYRDRLLHAVEEKVEGKEITAIGPEVQRTQVIDIMDALKQSLEQRMTPSPRLAKRRSQSRSSRRNRPRRPNARKWPKRHRRGQPANDEALHRQGGGEGPGSHGSAAEGISAHGSGRATPEPTG
jgi:DNA end-binding protein Ku